MNQTAEPAKPSGAKPGGFLSYRRVKETSPAVLLADKLADRLITVGGLTVIVAVFAIMVFLAAVVVPLFTPEKIDASATYRLTGVPAEIVDLEIDEHRSLAVLVGADGTVFAFHPATGTPLRSPRFDFDGIQATDFARTVRGGHIAIGFTDGSVRFGRLRFTTEVLLPRDVPDGLTPLDERDRTDGASVFTYLPYDQVRRVRLVLDLDEPQPIAAGQAITALDYRVGGTAERPTRAFVTVAADNTVRLSMAQTRVNLLTRQATTQVNTAVLPDLPAAIDVASVTMTERADQVYVATRDGQIYRYDTRHLDRPVLVEPARVLPAGVELKRMRFLIGEQSLVVAGSDGSVNVYFRLPRPGAGTSDGYRLVRAHELTPHGDAVKEISPSQRGKTFATASVSGEVFVRHSTSEQVLLRMAATEGDPEARHLILAPRENAVLTVEPNGHAAYWTISIPHPETTVRTLFGKVWYEGYSEPGYTWQSSSGSDVFEPKLSLIPLIFGTLKATVYAMLFALPIALLGAIYTSQFLHHRVRGVIKPTMEMMESLPTVVLGFIAALVLAPLVETWIAAVMMAFVVLPLSLLLAAYGWQFLPSPLARRMEGLFKFAFFFVVIAAACVVAYRFGPWFERLFFAGDLKSWADGRIGGDTRFTALLLFPAAYLLTMLAVRRVIGDYLEDRIRAAQHPKSALLDAGRWLGTLLLAAAVSYLLAEFLVALDLGVRGGMVGTYVQRNALVVGFAMGFAIIPVIYTISEDALTAVPVHLRAASLAAGATPWQTATHIILPTALSGIFSAVMIGMGRAVGETMIVVMAAGNTPVLDWNIFNGLRALSANIAVELPEAVKDGTLYRVLFLAALTLFVMTFVVNTLAELVRQRFRRRAAQL